MIDQITTRCARPADEPFLRLLYIDTHPEFGQLPPDVAAGIADLQFRAQRGSYLASFPTAIDHVVDVAGVPVGRCWTCQSDTDLRLLDIAVLRSHQRRGIGRKVLQTLKARADEAGVALSLSVWQDNLPARKLYEQLGFVVRDEVNGYLGMVSA